VTRPSGARHAIERFNRAVPARRSKKAGWTISHHGERPDGFEVRSELTDGDREAIVRVLTPARQPGLRLHQLIDECGVDYPERDKRFDVVYHLLSPEEHARPVKVHRRGDPRRPRPSPVFPAPNWFEREAYDLYGILFSGHPDLRRILTDYGFEGHPLQQGLPADRLRRGPLRRRAEARRLRAGPAPQEFRQFDFLSPWEGTDYVLPGDEKPRRPELRRSWPSS
jgi:NADH-quinone oxidoreductase subunit C